MRWIVTDDIFSETWRQLLEYSNIELTTDIIIQKHGEPRSKSHRENLLKQATQARVCVLQAKEYFDAARAASLFTSPNHSYYGSVALASLMLLVLGDGKKSLDYLRIDNRNNHHGLDFTTGCNAKSASAGIALIEQSRVEMLEFGHFPNWYKILPPNGSVSAIVEQSYGSTGHIGMRPIGNYTTTEFEKIKGKKRTLLELLKFLPDLDSDLQRYGITAVRSRTSHHVRLAKDGQATHTWLLHGCRSESELASLLEEFRIIPRFADNIKFNGPEHATSGIVSVQYKTGEGVEFHWPSIRDTMNHDSISYAGMPDTHEIVDLYLVAYQLSMLSRYFPDIWVSCIESNCRAAKLIERATGIITRKLPILALSILSGEDTVISTHREPWKNQSSLSIQ